MHKRFFAVAVLIAFVAPIAAQVPERKDPKEEVEKLRKEGVAFLRETMGDVANMRTLENRISFSAEMAGLMWYHDEREARVMFSSAIADLRELLARIQQQMNEFPDEDGETNHRGGLMTDVSGRARLEMKYRVATGVRQQIASAIAEHDPDFALSFYHDTASPNPKHTLGIGSDSYFEFNLLGQIAAKNPAKALQLGSRSITGGVESHHVGLLRQIYEKNPENGAEFGRVLLSHLKSEKALERNMAVLESLIEYGEQRLASSEKAGGRGQVYNISEIKELAELMASSLLSHSVEDGAISNVYIHVVQKYLPGRAAQIRSKFRETMGAAYLDPETFERNSNVASNAVPTSGRGNSANTNANSDLIVEEPMPPGRQSEDDRLEADIEKLSKGELPKEERERAIAQARKILMQTQGRDKQIVGLSMLAAQVAKAGDKELAVEIMRDAERLVNPSPKNYQDFVLTWMVASGYAETEPDRAFVILEDAIGRANAIISAFVQVGEFIDVTEEMISDGEAQVGAFGGGMIRGLGKELGIAEATIDKLAHADFAKTKALTNRFDRPEVRVLAKMLVLRTVLGKKAAPSRPVNMDVLN